MKKQRAAGRLGRGATSHYDVHVEGKPSKLVFVLSISLVFIVLIAIYNPFRTRQQSDYFLASTISIFYSDHGHDDGARDVKDNSSLVEVDVRDHNVPPDNNTVLKPDVKANNVPPGDATVIEADVGDGNVPPDNGNVKEVDVRASNDPPDDDVVDKEADVRVWNVPPDNGNIVEEVGVSASNDPSGDSHVMDGNVPLDNGTVVEAAVLDNIVAPGNGTAEANPRVNEIPPKDGTIVEANVKDHNLPPGNGTVAEADGGYKECDDIFSGEWVPDPNAPYYTNLTCFAIHEHQNCMKYGRPDSGFLKWRWKPFGCDLPLFDPVQFFELVKGKSMAFVGDSLARNQVQSLICLLSRVEYPVDVSYTKDERFKRWNYASYNFTLAMFTSPHLVKANESNPDGPAHSGVFNLYLDETDEEWMSHVDEFDHLIISGGHWFFRSQIFYEKKQKIGCHLCLQNDLPYVSNNYGYRKALGTVFTALNRRRSYRGITYLRTLSPSHFEGGLWNAGGDCLRRRPYSRNETIALGSEETELYKIQKEEFRKAEIVGKKRGRKYRLLDITEALLQRPDGHPSKYGHPPGDKWFNDCVHWCLPGPVDVWSDFLMEMMRRDDRISAA